MNRSIFQFSFSLMSKFLVLVFSIIGLSACSSQLNEETPLTTESNVEKPIDNQNLHPDFIKKLIIENKSLPEHEQATAITRYVYKGEFVYLVTPPCCDFFAKLYNNKGILLGSPSGGLTGKGDGSLADFDTLKTDAYGVWKKGK